MLTQLIALVLYVYFSCSFSIYLIDKKSEWLYVEFGHRVRIRILLNIIFLYVTKLHHKATR
jgi:hypothetical protein